MALQLKRPRLTPEVKRLLAIKAEEELTANQTAPVADLRSVE